MKTIPQQNVDYANWTAVFSKTGPLSKSRLHWGNEAGSDLLTFVISHSTSGANSFLQMPFELSCVFGFCRSHVLSVHHYTRYCCKDKMD
jgi:hypothetical protein